MSTKPGVSRRGFMRTAAAVAAAPAVVASASTASAGSADVLVAATVVRASHSPATRGALKIGVRASVLAEGLSRDNIVVTVDDVRFGASTDEIRATISKAVQRRIARELETAGRPVSLDKIAVQVFGGVL